MNGKTVNLDIFVRILFSQIAFKDIFAALKTRLGHNEPISVNDRVIKQFRQDSIFDICQVSQK